MFVTIKAKTRGKATREVSYQGIGKFEDVEVEKRDDEGKLEKDADGKQVMTTEKELKTEGVVVGQEGLKAMLAEAYKGNIQDLIDDAVVGYNARQFRLASDALAEYIDSAWSSAQIAAFRLAVNNLMKLGAPVEMAVTAAKSFIK